MGIIKNKNNGAVNEAEKMKNRVEVLELALKNIATMARTAINERPKEMAKNQWDYVLSSIEMYAERAAAEEQNPETD